MASKWTKKQLDVPFANAIAEFTELNDSIVSESSSFGYKITVFCFLVVLVTNFHFQKRVTGEQLAHRQDLHGELDRNKAQKTTELFVMGEQKSIDDVVHALFNMMCSLTFVNTNGCHCGFFAFASNSEKILSLSDDKAVPPMQLEEARIHADEVLKDVKVAVSKSSNPFGDPSLVWQSFHYDDRKPSAASKGANAGRNVVVIKPPLKLQKSANAANDDLVNCLKQTGFFRCIDSGRAQE
ncbi:hypothetical protein IV203_017960 [Nitzschia inconspicua]|uniref:Uncharacterized protein n=1 Tax=Nitzschia inconspicua TaxID=303405 RepID=A0A9K3Q5G6_9STRA|nr:hypothetical protein IV203_017960 [Nitzschia inconspicua]